MSSCVKPLRKPHKTPSSMLQLHREKIRFNMRDGKRRLEESRAYALLERICKLKELFVAKYGQEPSFYARAPGRVNLIGEHIDYCGYAVLPMAIEQDILAAVQSVDTAVLHLSNTNPVYLDFSGSIHNIEIDKTKPLWHNYFLCGLKGIQDHFNLSSPTGMNCLVDGTIPASSGLSSSSALVCCAGFATLIANGKTLSKIWRDLEVQDGPKFVLSLQYAAFVRACGTHSMNRKLFATKEYIEGLLLENCGYINKPGTNRKPEVELAETCAKCERYIGTEGGGMDQSISFLAEEGTAKLIEFNPLRSTDVKLPTEAVFVIANSCVEMNKAATAHFNIRVVECRLATKILAKSKGLDWRSLMKLGDLQCRLGVSLEKMQDVVEEILHPELYTREEICEILEITLEELRTTILSQNTQDVSTFRLYQRAKHVYTEAARVLAFKKVCDEAPANAVQLLGDLMNQSHVSCRDLYECSCTELDQLVDICLKSGAIGSRLTGAGWGGCTVSMVPTDKLKDFLSNVQDKFYKTDERRTSLLKQSLFATKPGSGAVILLDQK